MTEEVKILLFSIAALVVGLVVGAIIGIIYRKKVAEAEIGSAEAEAKRITKAIDRLKLDNITTSQSKTFIKDE